MKSDLSIMYAVETIKSGLEHLTGDRTTNSSGIEKTNQKKKTARRCFILHRENTRSTHTKAVRMITKVRLPSKDPVFGKKGPVKKLWKSAR